MQSSEFYHTSSITNHPSNIFVKFDFYYSKYYDLSSIIEAEEDPISPLYKFWKEVNTHGKVR